MPNFNLFMMHEISLVRNMLRTLQEEFPDRIDKLVGIYLQVGLLSNIQPILLQTAFEAVLLDEPTYSGARLKVEVLPILIACDACGATTEVQDYHFVCRCGAPSSNIIQGQEMMISKVEFEIAYT